MKQRPVKFFLAAFLATALFSCGNQAKQDDPKELAEERNEETLKDDDLEDASEFVVNAAAGGMMEVQLGKLAQTKATTPEVKQFAKTMVDQHTAANDELKTLAQQKNITIPAALSEEHQEKYNDLNEKQGIEFDRAYMDYMVEDHEEDVDAFEKQAENGDVPEIKTWASNKVSTLKQHHEMAKSLKETLDDRD